MLTKENIYKFYLTLFVLFATLSFNSCEIIGDIFEAGIWTGIIIIVLIVALLIWIFSRFRGRN